MSSVDTRPPQTYSRLFRPWDSKAAAAAENCRNKSDSDFAPKHNFEDILKNAGFIDPAQLVQYPLDMTSLASPNNLLGIKSTFNDIYYGGNNGLTMPGVFGVVDPVSLNLMEQEYARVMAEDAHIKALNSRKQRPKKFKCPHCDVAFSNNGQLKGHIRIHTGERPFKCDVESCGKTFTRNEELTRHKRIHTGLRPFGCSTCGKKFGRRDHLKKHMKTHLPQEKQLGSIFVPMYPYLYGY